MIDKHEDAIQNAWLKQIRLYNQNEMRLNTVASALLVIDMPRFFLNTAFPAFTCGGAATWTRFRSLGLRPLSHRIRWEIQVEMKSRNPGTNSLRNRPYSAGLPVTAAWKR